MFLYVELLSVLVEAPSRYPQALTGVIHTLQNLMHLTNLLRQPQVGPQPPVRRRPGPGLWACAEPSIAPPPHVPLQARQGLEEQLQQRVQRKREAIGEVRHQMAGVRQVLDAATAALVAAGGDSAESSLPRQPGQPQQGHGQAAGAGGAAAMDTA